jgi:hypothetical protein
MQLTTTHLKILRAFGEGASLSRENWDSKHFWLCRPGYSDRESEYVYGVTGRFFECSGLVDRRGHITQSGIYLLKQIDPDIVIIEPPYKPPVYEPGEDPF